MTKKLKKFGSKEEPQVARMMGVANTGWEITLFKGKGGFEIKYRTAIGSYDAKVMIWKKPGILYASKDLKNGSDLETKVKNAIIELKEKILNIQDEQKFNKKLIDMIS